MANGGGGGGWRGCGIAKTIKSRLDNENFVGGKHHMGIHPPTTTNLLRSLCGHNVILIPPPPSPPSQPPRAIRWSPVPGIRPDRIPRIISNATVNGPSADGYLGLSSPVRSVRPLGQWGAPKGAGRRVVES